MDFEESFLARDRVWERGASMRDIDQGAVVEAMQSINRAAQDPQGRGMEDLLDPEFLIGSPGLDAAPAGREEYIAAIADFWSDAVPVEFRDTHLQVQVTGNTAVATFAAELIVDRGEERSRSAWRDVWVFTRRESEWLAVWRTILDFDEKVESQVDVI